MANEEQLFDVRGPGEGRVCGLASDKTRTEVILFIKENLQQYKALTIHQHGNGLVQTVGGDNELLKEYIADYKFTESILFDPQVELKDILSANPPSN